MSNSIANQAQTQTTSELSATLARRDGDVVLRHTFRRSRNSVAILLWLTNKAGQYWARACAALKSNLGRCPAWAAQRVRFHFS